jgi:alpha-amylase
MKIFSAFVLFTFILIGCIPSNQPAPQITVKPVATPTASPTSIADSTHWWKDAVFYEIFVRSFKDSDGDGIGDFNGITQNLDYLQQLGVNAIWLMPIHPSPSYHGYDVINYYAVNFEYGTMGDFKHLLEEAHDRGIHIIIDLVLNHTSSQHPWFTDSNSNTNSKYHDYYVWSDSSGGNGWYQGQNGYYFAFFCECMPDLNYRNAEVTADMLKITDYWLQNIGVDGFRVDAAKHLIEDGDIRENTPATHKWYKDFYIAYKAQNPQAYTVGEVYGAGASLVKSYTGDQLDQIFNFEMSSGFVNSVNGGAISGVTSAIKFALQDMPDFNFATFLTNHDQNRAMSVFHGDLGKAKAAATLLLTSPGTPFIYYGEEIGMQGQKPDEDIRLPMQWNSDINAGFTTGMPWRAPAPDYQQVNVESQNEDPNSLLNHYRALIKLRMEYPALSSGDITLVETGNSAVYAVLRSSDNGKILVMVNLKAVPISDYQLSLKENLLSDGVMTPHSLLGTIDALPVTILGGRFSEYKPIDELLPHKSYLFQLE